MFDDTNSPRSCGDLSFFVYNFIDFIQIAIDRTIEDLSKWNNKLDDAHDLIKNMNLKQDKFDAIVFLLYQGYILHEKIDIKTIADYIDCSIPTASKYVNQLVNDGTLIKSKDSKKFVYLLSADVIKQIDN